MRYTALNVGQTEEWSELTNTFVPMEHRYLRPARWRSELTVQQNSRYSLLRWDEPDGRIADRTRGNVARVPADDFYWLVVPDRSVFGVRWADPTAPTTVAGRHDGRIGTARDGAIRVADGRGMLMGLDQECRLRPGAAAYAMQLPRAEIEHALPATGPMRRVLDLDSGLGRVVDSMMRSAHAEQDRLGELEFNAICERLGELVCLLLTGDMRPHHDHLTETAAAVRRYVRETVGTGDVRLPAVAHALGWSPRQLRLILQQCGTTYRDLRREESLRAARTMLERPDPAIAEVAARCGFTVTWFSAAFKQRFGETPREFRKRRLAELADR
ncbi:helix-turn-helix transcriptional regulator [Nocardia spumae]|uniref:helix-turn-helix transcriptional regulator n=1 Tax=Nocardia spumae TaxID=2887190 RepID=UPI001D154E5E|nr:AraC family transcriptional regulator [Nocardia spumae]